MIKQSIQWMLALTLILCLSACYEKNQARLYKRRTIRSVLAKNTAKSNVVRHPYQYYSRSQVKHLKNARLATLPHHLDQDETDLLTRVHQLGVRVIHEDVRLRMVMPGRCSFAPRSSAVNPYMMAVLDRLSVVLKRNRKTMAVIHGHTDNRGSKQANQALSERRSHAVIAYLESQGIAANRLVTEGYGSTQPIANNKNQQGRELNRRVEITLLEGPIQHDNYVPTS